MSNYTYPASGFTFGSRDNLAPGNNEKVIRGTQFDPEFTAIQNAIATKLDSNGSSLVNATINNTVIGNVTPAAAAFTTITGTLDTAAQPNITAVGTLASLVATTADINGGTIDGTVIGGTTAAAGTFTTFTSTGIDDNASATALTIDASGNVTAAGTITGLGDLAINTDTLFVDVSEGRVGINNAAPSAELEVNGSFVLNNSSADYLGIFRSPSFASMRIGANADNSWQLQWGANDELNFSNYAAGVATERMRITSSGNVGIGTASPDAALEVNGDIKLGAEVNSTRSLIFERSSADRANMYVDSSNLFHLNAQEQMIFDTAATERMRIDSSGNLLVGKTAVSTAVNGASISSIGQIVATTSVGNSLQSARAGDGQVMRFWNSSVSAGGITVTGNVPSFYNGTSDIRLKENVVAHEPELANIMSLRPVRFDMKDGSGVNVEGVIAQEVQKVYPDLVIDREENSEDSMLTVMDFGPMTIRLVKAIQEQQEIIENLRQRVAQLEA